MKRIVILASGSGSNAENIITYFRDSTSIVVSAVLTNKNTAPVIDRCKRLNVPAIYFNKTAFSDSKVILDFLVSQKPAKTIKSGFCFSRFFMENT